MPLGSTDSGKDWCLKALHPSDPLNEVRGIPDRSAVPSVFMNYQTVFTLTPAPAATGVWSFNAALLPNPVDFMYLNRTDTTGTTALSVLNSQLNGATFPLKVASFMTDCERWRLAYMSVTVYQDGAALTDQGTLVAAQSVVKPAMMSCGGSGPNYLLYPSPSIAAYAVNDLPDFDKSQSMPNAFFSRSKEGAYMPLKLTDTCQDWQSPATNQLLHGALLPNGFSLAYVTENPTPTAGSLITPYPHLVQASRLANDGVPGANLGALVPAMCNDNWGFISARNLSVSTSYSFFIRAGYEIQVQPGTVLTPQQKLSPPHDSLALDTYFAIAREMKDAYPADYNDLGKIWDVISRIGTTISPVLSAIHPALGAGVAGGIRAGNAIKSYFASQGKERSAGNTERTRLALDSAVAAVKSASKSRSAPKTKKKQSKGRVVTVLPKTKKVIRLGAGYGYVD